MMKKNFTASVLMALLAPVTINTASYSPVQAETTPLSAKVPAPSETEAPEQEDRQFSQEEPAEHDGLETISELPSPNDIMDQGHYLAVLSDCAACHSTLHRPAYSGGLAFETPIGTVFSTNITPDPHYGIGDYSEKDFARAVREGVRKDGSALYPAMPYPSYARMSNKDVHALYLYFHNGVKPAAIPVPPNKIPWPLSIRWPLHIWRWLFSPDVSSAQRATRTQFSDPVLSRGAYLVEGPGHCGSCHSPRDLTMNEKALSASDNPAYLSGGQTVEGWFIPSLRQENRTGLGRWTEQDIVDFLKTGRSTTGAAFGGMAPVEEHSMRKASDSDLHAIARFLMTLQPAHPEEPWQPSSATEIALKKGDASVPGAQIYVDRCAACHRINGRGYGTVFPPLAGNPIILTQDPTSIVHIVQAGARTVATPATPSGFTMPGFADKLSDREIADVVSFIRQAWGNQVLPVSESEVAELRKTTPPPLQKQLKELFAQEAKKHRAAQQYLQAQKP